MLDRSQKKEEQYKQRIMDLRPKDEIPTDIEVEFKCKKKRYTIPKAKLEMVATGDSINDVIEDEDGKQKKKVRKRKRSEGVTVSRWKTKDHEEPQDFILFTPSGVTVDNLLERIKFGNTSFGQTVREAVGYILMGILLAISWWLNLMDIEFSAETMHELWFNRIIFLSVGAVVVTIILYWLFSSTTQGFCLSVDCFDHIGDIHLGFVPGLYFKDQIKTVFTGYPEEMMKALRALESDYKSKVEEKEKEIANLRREIDNIENRHNNQDLREITYNLRGNGMSKSENDIVKYIITVASAIAVTSLFWYSYVYL